MPRKRKPTEKADDPAWKVLPGKRQTVPISSLRLRTQAAEVALPLYDESRYSMRVREDISPEIVTLLLELYPIAAVRQKRELEVVTGARLFSIAAFCLDPSAEISVLLLDKRFCDKNEELLRYLDLAVMPLLHTLDGSAKDLHQVFNISGLREQVWLPPLKSVSSAFARALGVTPSALLAPLSRKRKKGRKANSTPPPSVP